MIEILKKQEDKYAELWVSGRDSDDWKWAFSILPTLLHQDNKFRPGLHFQKASDLDLLAMPLYACRIPSVMLFPFVTFFADTWSSKLPSFMILRQPLNRKHGRNWLYNSALNPSYIMNGGFEKNHLFWSDAAGNTRELDIEQEMRMASAAKTYLLEEIRYVYDETESALSGKKTSRPSRYSFNEKTASFGVTKPYLSWYIDQFNTFFKNLLEIGKQNDPEMRILCTIAGLTVSRLAVDVLIILLSDVPSIRKWQFFSFIDAFASLFNLLSKNKENYYDKQRAIEFLQVPFSENELVSIIDQIPVVSIQGELKPHTKNIYDSINSMGIEIASQPGERSLFGPELLWAYRHARHGYALRDETEKMVLLFDSGKIPNDLPDLVIALWHYILKFPFT